jgi:deoxyhypusine synthase
MMLPRETKLGRDGKMLPHQTRPTSVSDFIDHHYRHFNAATLKDAADGYLKLLSKGGLMFVSLAGAMSTGEIGLSLAEMIRQHKVHAICCTGANLEEDVFNLVAHDQYERIPDYSETTPQDDKALQQRKMARVTDTAIPEEAAMAVVEDPIIELWMKADKAGQSKFPHEYLYDLLQSKQLEPHYNIDPSDSWMVAASAVNLPIYVPGWEDSTLGNVFAALRLKGELKHTETVKGGLDYMQDLARWYTGASADHPVGFFQIGGGIAGDFSICVVPLLRSDFGRKNTPFWAYFCQITDATESYGGYSGASAQEKITWQKIDVDTPTFMIQSDASICAPLVFAKVLGW